MSLAMKAPDLAFESIDVDSISFNGSSSHIRYENSFVGSFGTGGRFVVSFWCKPNIGANETHTIIEANEGTLPGNASIQQIELESNSGSNIRLKIHHFNGNSSNTGERLEFISSYGKVTNNAWNHIAYSGGGSAVPTAGLFSLMINDVHESSTTDGSRLSLFPGNTDHETHIGANFNDAETSSSNRYSGCLAEFYVHQGTNQFYDFSVVANRRKFISASKKPVTLPPFTSVSGSSVSGMYLRGTASTWANTAGEDVGTTMGTQTLSNITNCADSPSD